MNSIFQYLKSKYPKSFWLMCFTITWERFSYHGIATILVLYFTTAISKGGMGLSIIEATSLYGFFVGVLHLTPLIGGWLSDFYIGQQKSIILGGFFISLGNFLLFFSRGGDKNILYLGLLGIMIGNGFFKANCTNLVGNIYADKKPSEKEIAYSLFYMFINLGSFLAPFTAGLIADKFMATVDLQGNILKFGYRPMFLVCSIIAIIWTLLFFYLAPKFLGDLGKKPYKNTTNNKNFTLSFNFSKEEIKNIKLMGIISIFVILFWTAFYQSFSSIALYARDHGDRNLGSFVVPVPWFPALNAISGIIFSPFLVILWEKLKKYKVDAPIKISVGLFSMGIAFLFMSISSYITRDVSKANMIFIVLAFLFNTISELCTAPVGIATFNRLAPKQLSTIFMGIWYMTMCFGSIISGKIAGVVQNIGFFPLFSTLTIVLFIGGGILLILRKKF